MTEFFRGQQGVVQLESGTYLPNRRVLRRWVKRCYDHGRGIVFTNGCFDVLHRGHVHFLDELRMTYASLPMLILVALNSDKSIRRLKGRDRPINTLLDRAAVVGSLRSVSVVTYFDEDTPEELLKIIRPEVLAKSGEFADVVVPGEEYVLSYGGKVWKQGFLPGYSTTNIVHKLKLHDGK